MEDYVTNAAHYMALTLNFSEWVETHHLQAIAVPPVDLDSLQFDERVALQDRAFRQFYDLLSLPDRKKALALYYHAQVTHRGNSDATDVAAACPGNWRVLLRTLCESSLGEPDRTLFIIEDDLAREGTSFPPPFPMIRQILRETTYAPWGDTLRAFFILRYGGAHTTTLLREKLVHPRSSIILFRLLEFAPTCTDAPTSAVEAALHPERKHRPLFDALDLQQVVAPLYKYMSEKLRREQNYVDCALKLLSIALGPNPTETWQAQDPKSSWRLRPDSSMSLTMFGHVGQHPPPRELVEYFLREI